MEYINGKTKALLVGLAALVAVSGVAWSKPLAANLYVGTLKDVNGFDGRALPDGSYIEFRTMYKAGSTWMTYAPTSAWLETRNPLKAKSKVGYGVIESARGRGLFAACVSGLDPTNQYVARLFSGPTPEESVAYCDSTPFIYTADDTRSVTNVTFGDWKAMDGSILDIETDSDGDGLADSVESLSALTDPDNPDTDGDGFSDGFEFEFSMNPLEPYQLEVRLDIVSPNDESWQDAGVEPEPLYSLTWSALSGRTYRVEYQPSMRPASTADEWKVISKVSTNAPTAKFTYYLEEIEDDDTFDRVMASPSGFFRVRRIDDASDSEEGSIEDSLGE